MHCPFRTYIVCARVCHRSMLSGEQEIWWVVINLLNALYHLHSNCIVHRDVKPLNVLLGSSNLLYPNVMLSGVGQGRASPAAQPAPGLSSGNTIFPVSCFFAQDGLRRGLGGGTRDPGSGGAQGVDGWYNAWRSGGTWASRTRKRSEAGCGRPEGGGAWAAKTVKRPPQQPAQPPVRQLLGTAIEQTAPATFSTAPAHQTTGLRERGNDTSKSTGRSGRQKAATRRNMRREERVTVQGPVKEQQPDGMSHEGGGGGAGLWLTDSG